jgi:hypothetical protein
MYPLLKCTHDESRAYEAFAIEFHDLRVPHLPEKLSHFRAAAQVALAEKMLRLVTTFVSVAAFNALMYAAVVLQCSPLCVLAALCMRKPADGSTPYILLIAKAWRAEIEAATAAIGAVAWGPPVGGYAPADAGPQAGAAGGGDAGGGAAGVAPLGATAAADEQLPALIPVEGGASSSASAGGDGRVAASASASAVADPASAPQPQPAAGGSGSGGGGGGGGFVSVAGRAAARVRTYLAARAAWVASHCARLPEKWALHPSNLTAQLAALLNVVAEATPGCYLMVTIKRVKSYFPWGPPMLSIKVGRTSKSVLRRIKEQAVGGVTVMGTQISDAPHTLGVIEDCRVADGMRHTVLSVGLETAFTLLTGSVLRHGATGSYGDAAGGFNNFLMGALSHFAGPDTAAALAATIMAFRQRWHKLPPLTELRGTLRALDDEGGTDARSVGLRQLLATTTEVVAAFATAEDTPGSGIVGGKTPYNVVRSALGGLFHVGGALRQLVNRLARGWEASVGLLPGALVALGAELVPLERAAAVSVLPGSGLVTEGTAATMAALVTAISARWTRLPPLDELRGVLGALEEAGGTDARIVGLRQLLSALVKVVTAYDSAGSTTDGKVNSDLAVYKAIRDEIAKLFDIPATNSTAITGVVDFLADRWEEDLTLPPGTRVALGAELAELLRVGTISFLEEDGHDTEANAAVLAAASRVIDLQAYRLRPLADVRALCHAMAEAGGADARSVALRQLLSMLETLASLYESALSQGNARLVDSAIGSALGRLFRVSVDDADAIAALTDRLAAAWESSAGLPAGTLAALGPELAPLPRHRVVGAARLYLDAGLDPVDDAVVLFTLLDMMGMSWHRFPPLDELCGMLRALEEEGGTDARTVGLRQLLSAAEALVAAWAAMEPDAAPGGVIADHHAFYHTVYRALYSAHGAQLNGVSARFVAAWESSAGLPPGTLAALGMELGAAPPSAPPVPKSAFRMAGLGDERSMPMLAVMSKTFGADWEALLPLDELRGVLGALEEAGGTDARTVGLRQLLSATTALLSGYGALDFLTPEGVVCSSAAVNSSIKGFLQRTFGSVGEIPTRLVALWESSVGLPPGALEALGAELGVVRRRIRAAGEAAPALAAAGLGDDGDCALVAALVVVVGQLPQRLPPLDDLRALSRAVEDGGGTDTRSLALRQLLRALVALVGAYAAMGLAPGGRISSAMRVYGDGRTTLASLFGLDVTDSSGATALVYNLANRWAAAAGLAQGGSGKPPPDLKALGKVLTTQ